MNIIKLNWTKSNHKYPITHDSIQLKFVIWFFEPWTNPYEKIEQYNPDWFGGFRCSIHFFLTSNYYIYKQSKEDYLGESSKSGSRINIPKGDTILFFTHKTIYSIFVKSKYKISHPLPMESASKIFLPTRKHSPYSRTRSQFTTSKTKRKPLKLLKHPCPRQPPHLTR